jgi:two-component system, OmpR family, sensor histidine kinase KdpD
MVKTNLALLTKQLSRKRIFELLSRYFFVLVLLTASKLILIPFEPYLQIQLIALLYLLPVMISTVLWGLTSGILAGFVGFLVFNFFYIQPYYTFQVHQTQDLITLLIFLIVAVVMSQLIGRAREGMRIAQSREWEAMHMYELISALSGLQNTQNIAQTLGNHIWEAFKFDRIDVTISGENVLSITSPDGNNLPEKPSMKFHLKTSRSKEGEISLWHTRSYISHEESRLLGAYINQGALVLERARLADIETRAKILEESDQMKSALLNSVSHELRSPLAAIKASVSSLRSGTVDWNIPARQELLATVEEETDHLNALVGNLLDMSRIETGVLDPNIHWNSIEEIVMGVIIKMRKHFDNHHMELDFSEDLPLVPTDFAMMEQVFTNLISNCIKYAPTNSMITLSSYKEEEFLHTRVSNQGPPVPEEHLEKIFEKFHRVTEADRITGTGLGLSICKGIIEAHGGKIWAENQTDAFVFHFLLPLKLHGKLPAVPKEEENE